MLRSFCLAGKTATEAYDHLCKAYGNAAMSKSHTFRAFREFKEGRTDFKGKTGQHLTPRGSPKERTDENMAKVRDLIAEDARLTLTLGQWRGAR